MLRLATISLALLACLALPGAAAAGSLERLIAPERVCSGQARLGAPVAAQERTMRCMTNFARRRAGRAPLAAVGPLARSAGLKSRDMLRCGFDHRACGRDFAFWIKRVGYPRGRCFRLAENIAWGTGRLGSVRSIFRSWIRSPGHRRNILGRFDDLGVGLLIGNLEGQPGARVWTQHFGARCQ